MHSYIVDINNNGSISEFQFYAYDKLNAEVMLKPLAKALGVTFTNMRQQY